MARKVIVGRKERSSVNTAGVDVGTSVTPLSSDTRELKGGVQIVADSDNTGIVYVGTRTTLTAGTNATDGFPLSAGDTIFIPVDKESDIQLIADAASQAVHYLSY